MNNCIRPLRQRLRSCSARCRHLGKPWASRPELLGPLRLFQHVSTTLHSIIQCFHAGQTHLIGPLDVHLLLYCVSVSFAANSFAIYSLAGNQGSHEALALPEAYEFIGPRPRNIELLISKLTPVPAARPLLDTTAATIPGLSSVVRRDTVELAFVENVQVFSRACSRWVFVGYLAYMVPRSASSFRRYNPQTIFYIAANYPKARP